MLNENNINQFFENEQINEGAKETLISLSFIAQLLALPNILPAQDFYNAVGNKPTHAQLVDAVNKVVQTNKVYNGYAEAKVANILARTLYLEAANEDEEGIRYVATAIMNRANQKIENIVNVCFKPMQFSCWNSISPSTNKKYTGKNYALWAPSAALRKERDAVTTWNICKKIATEIIENKFELKGNYNMYYNPNKCTPSWSTKLTGTKTVGRHIFGYYDKQDPARKKIASKKPTYPNETTVKKGEIGVSSVAKRLINQKQTSFTNINKLTNAILACNNFKKDSKGNPIIHIGDKIKLPKS